MACRVPVLLCLLCAPMAACLDGEAEPDPASEAPPEAEQLDLQAALAQVQPGETIQLPAGVWTETVELPAGVRLVGAGMGQTVLAPAQGPGVLVVGEVGQVSIEGVTIEGARTFGLSAHGASVELVDVEISGTLKAGGPYGHGVSVHAAEALTMRGCVVSGNEGVGIVVGDVAGVELGGPVLWPPRSGVVGVVDARFEPQLVLSDNGEGGLAGVWDTPGYLRLEGAEVSGNGLAGVAVHGRVEVSVRDTAVLSTWSEPGQGGYGFAAMGYDALGPEVWIDAGSILSANEDTGIGALEGAVGGAVDLRVDAEVSLNGWFGVGAQGPRVDLALGEGALIAGCAYAGVVVASGAELKLDGARIVGSYAGEYALVGAGDGLWIKEGASAIVSGAFFAANEGAGIRARDAAALSVTATLIEGGTYGVVIEGPVDAEVEVTCVGQSEACEVAAP